MATQECLDGLDIVGRSAASIEEEMGAMPPAI